MQNPRLRSVYRQRKWPLPAPVCKIMALEREIMALGRKIMALGWQVFHYSVKCSKHDLRSFIDAVQRRLATQTVTMLTSCWQVLSEVELRRIFDAVNGETTWVSHAFVKKNMVRYMRPKGDSLTDRVKKQHLPWNSTWRPWPRVRIAFSHL